MNRTQSIDAIDTYDEYWDMLVIGGGATGLGCALDAASRGYKTLLVEQDDFAKGTSSRSTKLVHGGVRYLQQGNISLVLEALHERGLLMQNAPHLVRNQAFIVPNYEWWDGPFYGVGLKVYDLLAGRLGLGPSKWLSKEETLKRIPTLEPDRLRGGVIYYDGQFDDARLAVNLAQSIVDAGGVPVNYMQVTGLTYSGQMIDGVKLTDTISGTERNVRARVVVNATGIFTDDILKHAAQYMVEDPTRQDILCMFAGLRPLVGAEEGNATAAISRDHHLEVSQSGLVTITGGKWTTYRKMAEDSAGLMARELGRGSEWVQQQVAEFKSLAQGYLPD